MTTLRDVTGRPLYKRAGQQNEHDLAVTDALHSARIALARAKASQLADPDNTTDPVDKEVMAHIEAAEDALDQAIAAQAKDKK